MAESIIQKRSFRFAIEIIKLYCRLRDEREFVLSKQLLRSGTSIGANVEEASAGQSRKDFVSKTAIAAKEARETRYWLRLLKESGLVKTDVTYELGQADELLRMLTSIVKTTQETPGKSAPPNAMVEATQNSKLKTHNQREVPE